ncbi:hypothetical protein VM1G_07794 [Cytospora mali]|uniref:Uncharacterized protein n=1 Tax=Cytospora mali TaxID=578113 RepID=A0A194W805_CYTMA|nr:hypothetical protein VM1G_07794 [Valsa mali]
MTGAAHGTKRASSSNLGDKRPPKRVIPTSIDSPNNEGDFKSSAERSPVSRLPSMGRCKPKTHRKNTVSRRPTSNQRHGHGTVDAPSGPSGLSGRRENIKITKASSDKSEQNQDSSSDEPLVVKKSRKRNNAHAKFPIKQAEDKSEDDVPISSGVRRRLRTLDTSTTDSDPDESPSRPQNGRPQPLSGSMTNMEDQLLEANQKHEIAQNDATEVISLTAKVLQLMEKMQHLEETANNLCRQLYARHSRAIAMEKKIADLETQLRQKDEQLESRVAILAQQLRIEMEQRQNTFQSQLDENLRQVREELEARDQGEARRMAYIFGL